MPDTIRIFLASSSELEEDRRDFEIFIGRKNKDWIAKGVFLHLVIWEDFLDAVSKTRLQDEYNKAIRRVRCVRHAVLHQGRPVHGGGVRNRIRTVQGHEQAVHLHLLQGWRSSCGACRR